MNALAAITDAFAAQGYVVVRRLVPDQKTAQLRAHLESRSAAKALRMEGDSQVPGTPSAHGDPVLDALLEELRPAVEACTGLKLWPTYSYARLYRHGDELKPHRDRPACEVSLSLNLGQDPADQPWALNVKGAGASTAALLMPGDVLLYRGLELVHWREPYEGRHLAQVFLHYVDQNGPHAAQKYDGRSTLGTPLAQR